ncbi:hypothetical protein [Methylovulum miyakonense]|uniref:hypothetical protein n=1 Tax=Methylovulum miyakonense TaxID=645578 RepID=UPI00037E0C30|nr:hypothetical protein [Methylovulum miyakonense]
MKHGAFIGIILLSLSSYTFAADTQATQANDAKTSTATTPPQQDVGKAKENGQKQSTEPSPQKPSIADYCREHTC